MKECKISFEKIEFLKHLDFQLKICSIITYQNTGFKRIRTEDFESLLSAISKCSLKKSLKKLVLGLKEVQKKNVKTIMNNYGLKKLRIQGYFPNIDHDFDINRPSEPCSIQ